MLEQQLFRQTQTAPKARVKLYLLIFDTLAFQIFFTKVSRT